MPPLAPLATSKQFDFKPVTATEAYRVGIYGSGGIGKTSLACRAPGPVAIFDLENGLSRLYQSLVGLPIQRVEGITTWTDMREALHSPLWTNVRTIVIDSLTRAEQMATMHVLENISAEKGVKATSIESYGFGKGYRLLYETFLTLLGDLEQHYHAGRSIILIMHDTTATVPNPDGVDFLRWEPRLQGQEKNSIRLTVKEWLDHLFCIRYDVAINQKTGKAQGGETRTIYPRESAIHVAKSTLKDPIEYTEGNNSLWNLLKGNHHL